MREFKTVGPTGSNARPRLHPVLMQ
uniref:Uncharacterized protein n=1 Tax=Anguilla anguilla TaxID=7936 RepID=A0A0E9XCA2_ANGAN